jgi:hypothetical protein
MKVLAIILAIAVIVFVIARFPRIFSRAITAPPPLMSAHSGSYKGYSWEVTARCNVVAGPYYRAELTRLWTPDGLPVDISEFKPCLAVGEVAAVQQLDAIVREWIDDAA